MRDKILERLFVALVAISLVVIVVTVNQRVNHAAQVTQPATTGMVAQIVMSAGSPSTILTCNAAAEALIAWDYTNSIFYVCHSSVWASASAPPLTGTTGTITGTLLAVGGTDTGTVTVAGAVVGKPCSVSTTDGTNPSSSVTYHCEVTSTNTVTVTLQAAAIATPASKAYNVSVSR